MTLAKWLETKAPKVKCGPECPYCAAEAKVIALLFDKETPVYDHEKDHAVRASTAAWVLAIVKVGIVALLLVPLVWRK